jgi:capsid portal protein
VAAKDDFLNIKNSSRDDILAAHRCRPAHGHDAQQCRRLGDVEKAAKVFARNELVPLQVRIKHGLNTWAGMPVCDFEPYALGVTMRLPGGFPRGIDDPRPALMRDSHAFGLI